MKLLIIEDEISLKDSIQQYMEAQGYRCETAGNFEEAMDKIDFYEYDCILVDIGIPMGSGLDIIKELKELKSKAGIIIISARDAVDDKIIGLQLGSDDYLTKPFAFSELLARVRALGRRRSQPMLPSLNVLDLQINPLSHRVTRAGEQIDLTPNEFKVLEMLLRNAGNVVTRTDLLEHVWGLNFDPGSNIVDVVIKLLRDKIDRAFDPKLIQTVRGVGYTVRVEFGE